MCVCVCVCVCVCLCVYLACQGVERYPCVVCVCVCVFVWHLESESNREKEGGSALFSQESSSF